MSDALSGPLRGQKIFCWTGVFVINFEQILHFVLVLLLLTLNMFWPAGNQAAKT